MASFLLLFSPYFSEDEPRRHVCSSLRGSLENLDVKDIRGRLHFTVKRGEGSYGHFPNKTTVVFIDAVSFPFSFPRSHQRERDFTDFLC